MQTLTSLTPEIRQRFDSMLLTQTSANFGDNLKTILRMFRYIEKRLQKKTLRCPIQRDKFLILRSQFLEVYDKASTKEKDSEATKGNKAKRAFYYITLPNKSDRTIFDGIRRKSYRF